MREGFYCSECGKYVNDDIVGKGVCPYCGSTKFREMTIEDSTDYEECDCDNDYEDE